MVETLEPPLPPQPCAQDKRKLCRSAFWLGRMPTFGRHFSSAASVPRPTCAPPPSKGSRTASAQDCECPSPIMRVAPRPIPKPKRERSHRELVGVVAFGWPSAVRNFRDVSLCLHTWRGESLSRWPRAMQRNSSDHATRLHPHKQHRKRYIKNTCTRLDEQALVEPKRRAPSRSSPMSESSLPWP